MAGATTGKLSMDPVDVVTRHGRCAEVQIKQLGKALLNDKGVIATPSKRVSQTYLAAYVTLEVASAEIKKVMDRLKPIMEHSAKNKLKAAPGRYAVEFMPVSKKSVSWKDETISQAKLVAKLKKVEFTESNFISKIMAKAKVSTSIKVVVKDLMQS